MKKKSLFIGILLLFIVFIPGRIFAEGEDYLNYEFKTPLNTEGTVYLYVDKEFEHFIIAGNGKMDPEPPLGIKISFFFGGLSNTEKNDLKAHMKDLNDNGYVLEIKSGVQLPDDSTLCFERSGTSFFLQETGPETSFDLKEIIFPKDFDTSNITNMQGMFEGQLKLKTINVSNWNTSNVTNMSHMFFDATEVNPDVSKWDTSNVTNISFMFGYAWNANPDVSNWNTSNVTNMQGMFCGAKNANPDVSNWNTSNVTIMESMFTDAEKANPDVSKWDTSNVTNMSYMFNRAINANPDVSKWDTSNVTTMCRMFIEATKANPDVSKWDTSNVTNMEAMFEEATKANPDVSKWDTSNVTNMSDMFHKATNANPDVSNWNMSKVEDTSGMFDESGIIELDLRKWDPNSIFKNNYSYLMNCPKLQYIYLSDKSPLIGGGYYSNDASSFKKQKDNNAREDVFIDYDGGPFEFENTGADTVYFLPQETSLNVVWKDNENEKGFRPDKQKVKLLANGKDISAPMTIPQGENPVVLNDSNHWHHSYSDLDIFNGGKKIDYTVKSEDLDDYITDYVFKKEGTVLYSSQKGKIEDQEPGFTIINTYMTIAEEKPLGEKPRVPKNFVKVTVDTTDKATSDTQFKRVFWVTPNLELELPVGEPTGKSDQADKYTFEGWKGLEPSALKWNKGEKIKAKFTSDTTIEAQYKDESQQKPPIDGPKDKEDNPQKPPVVEPKNRIPKAGSIIFVENSPAENKSVDSKEEAHLAYIKGYPDGTVRPEGKVTRAEAVTMVVRLKGYPLIEGQGIYKDVEKDKWCAPYIEAAYRQGILEEKEGEAFRPDEKITRGELAQIISHIDKKNDAKAPFTDIEGYKFKKAIDQSYGNKRIMGYPDNTFKPNGEITRAETAAMLNRLFERHVRQEGLKDLRIKEFKDLKDKTYWAYYDIVEAANDHTCTRVEGKPFAEVWKTIIK